MNWTWYNKAQRIINNAIGFRIYHGMEQSDEHKTRENKWNTKHVMTISAMNYITLKLQFMGSTHFSYFARIFSPLKGISGQKTRK